MTKDTLNSIRRWFKAAKPNPTIKDQATQLGCHFEEVAEMLDAVGNPSADMCDMATYWKEAYGMDDLDQVDRHALLDALCDQIVTAIGVAHMFGMDIEGALAEVDESNWSKTEGDAFLYDADGKIIKGKFYRAPNLTPFLGGK